MEINIGNLKCTYFAKGCRGNLLPMSVVKSHYRENFFQSSISVSSAGSVFDQWRCTMCGHVIFKITENLSKQEICQCGFCEDKRNNLMAKLERAIDKKYVPKNYSDLVSGDWKKNVVHRVKLGMVLSAIEICENATGCGRRNARNTILALNH